MNAPWRRSKRSSRRSHFDKRRSAPLLLLKALTSGVKHRYPTRTANKRVVAEASLAVANTSFRWRASTQFAALPEDIKSEQNTKLFLNKLKRFTLENVKP